MKKYLFFPFFLFLTGCAVANLSNNELEDKGICLKEPSWVLKVPSDNGYIYGVGIAPPNFQGEQAQRKSAFSKAITEIATQMKTEVNSELFSNTTLINGSSSFSMQEVSFHKVNGEKVTAKVIKSCKNPSNGYFYILMKAKK